MARGSRDNPTVIAASILRLPQIPANQQKPPTMRLTLRTRIVLTLIPMLFLLTAVGGAGIALLYRLGDRIDAILRENYRSVNYMERLNEALERIDSAFHFTLAGRSGDARPQYDRNWAIYHENLALEQANITLKGERELVTQLLELTQRYRNQGDEFFANSANPARQITAYHDAGGLFPLFQDIKQVASEIRRINQQNMEDTGTRAAQTVRYSVTVLGGGLALAVFLAVLLTWQLIRTILNPIRAVTEIAREISSGNLDQVLPVDTNDEVGQLAQAFNLMARHLREYRQTQLDQLTRAQRASQATIDSFPDPVLVIDGTGRVDMANPAARRLLGVTPTQHGQPTSGYWQPPETLREPLFEALQHQRDYLPESFEHTILWTSKSGESFLLPRILTIRDRDNHSLGAAVVLQDVTRLRLLDQIKNNLVATASHELKTPLTGLRLAVHLLLEEAVGPLNPKQLELLIDARENSERLLAVVNNLLDLARIEQGWHQLDLRPESPRRVLQAAADAIHSRAIDKSIELQMNVPEGLSDVSIDPEKINHALCNLLDNALTYTDRGGRINLSAVADGNSIVLSVSDSGCGIPAEYLPQIFDKFFRVPGQSRGSGTGLGLAIVREIVTAHRGSIHCESQPGVGTTFRIRLPVAADSTPSHSVVGEADGHQLSLE